MLLKLCIKRLIHNNLKISRYLKYFISLSFCVNMFLPSADNTLLLSPSINTLLFRNIALSAFWIIHRRYKNNFEHKHSLITINSHGRLINNPPWLNTYNGYRKYLLKHNENRILYSILGSSTQHAFSGSN